MYFEFKFGFLLGTLAGSAALILWLHHRKICFNSNCEGIGCNNAECLLPDTDEVKKEAEKIANNIKDDIVDPAKEVVEKVKSAKKKSKRKRNKENKE